MIGLYAHALLQLNYIAVIKSCKKRNRQLAEGLAPTPVPPTRAVELLSQQYFFTSPKLAALTTEAEITFKVRVFLSMHPHSWKYAQLWC